MVSHATTGIVDECVVGCVRLTVNTSAVAVCMDYVLSRYELVCSFTHITCLGWSTECLVCCFLLQQSGHLVDAGVLKYIHC